MFNHEIKCSFQNYFNMYKNTLFRIHKVSYTRCPTKNIMFKNMIQSTSCRVCHTNVSCIMCYANCDMHNLSCITCYSMRVLQYVLYRTLEILTICRSIIFHLTILILPYQSIFIHVSKNPLA